MGGSFDRVDKIYSGGLGKKSLESVGVLKKKKKGKLTSAQQQAARNTAARGAAPLLQQTALSPDEPVGGAGTALL